METLEITQDSPGNLGTPEEHSPAWVIYHALRAWCCGGLGLGTAQLSTEPLAVGAYFFRVDIRVEGEGEEKRSYLSLIEFGKKEGA